MAGRAAIFAGQGAQFVGMGKDLADTYPACRELFDRADDALGYRLSRICFEGPEEDLTKSNHCQPAIFVVSTACRTALLEQQPGVEFAGMAGLSLGEWSALHAAGVMSFEDALLVLEARGRFMQDACEARDGAMVSIIGLPEKKLRDICDAAGVTVSNLNSAQQTVLSGDRQAIEKAEKLAGEAGARRAVILNVAGAYHSALMAPAAERLAEVLAGIEFRRPEVPVVSNVTGCPHEKPDEIRQSMLKQVTSPVQWLSCVDWFGRNGIAEYVEFGPGKVLSGLVKRIDRGASLHNIQDCSTLRKTVEGLQAS